MHQFKSLNRPLILDGAVGSLLQQLGAANDPILWSSIANITDPEIVINLHKDYISAGAEIISTNTFRTNPAAVKLSNHSLDLKYFVRQSVDLVKRAINDSHVFIAGVNPPAEDSYQAERTISKPELEYNHKKHIELLYSNNVDFILNETQSHWDELELIGKFCQSNKIPFVISLFFTNELRLLSGQPLNEAIEFIKIFEPLAISFNCVNIQTFKLYSKNLPIDYPWGFYLNCGSGDYKDRNIECGISPDKYVSEIENELKLTPLFVGTCCGSSPEHTKELRRYFD